MVSVDAMDNESNASPQTWRVVVACDEVQPHTHVREVEVYRDLGGWFTSATGCHGLATPRAAAQTHAEECHWSVVEILAPGAQTSAEEVAAEREACASLVDLCEQFARTMGDASADEYMKLAAAIRARAQGGPTGDLPDALAEVVRLHAEIERLTKERDDAILERMRAHQEAGLIEG